MVVSPVTSMTSLAYAAIVCSSSSASPAPQADFLMVVSAHTPEVVIHVFKCLRFTYLPLG